MANIKHNWNKYRNPRAPRAYFEITWSAHCDLKVPRFQEKIDENFANLKG